MNQPMNGIALTMLVTRPRIGAALPCMSRIDSSNVMACKTNMTPSTEYPELITKTPPMIGIARKPSAIAVIHFIPVE